MKKIDYYDIIIVGGGIAGLYSAYNILKISPKSKLLILEAYKKKWFGGRTGTVDFYGTPIPKGAGIGRKNKDYLLIDLLKDLKVHYSEFISKKYYAQTIHPPCQVKSVISLLQKALKERKVNASSTLHPTFEQFCRPILGSENYNHLTTCLGYRDYEKEDAYDVLFNYGFDDNYGKDIELKIIWSQLTTKLASFIGEKNIVFSSKVVAIRKSTPDFLIDVDNGYTYSSRKVIIATTIKSIVELLPGFPIYRQIHGYNFLRVYGKFSKKSIPIMEKYVPGYIIVPGPLQKLIPMNPTSGIYMIAYADNRSATFLKNKDVLENNEENRQYFCKLIAKSLGLNKEESDELHLISIKDFYWPIGTHYCQPLNTKEYKNRIEFLYQAQRPMHNMVVVGEVVSNDQGWVEGALDSVENVVTKNWVIN
jgi:hypothetical protein